MWQRKLLSALAITCTAKNKSRGVKVNKNILLTIMLCTVASCASYKSTGTVIESAPGDVEDCKYISNVIGTSGWGGLASTTGINNAKEQAKQQAIELGATHMVWQSINGGYSPSVSANAYKCK